MCKYPKNLSQWIVIIPLWTVPISSLEWMHNAKLRMACKI